MYTAQNMFKSYDIRGIYPDEINEDAMYEVGRAYAEFMKEETGKNELELVVCQDMRDSSDPIKQAVIKGLRDRGVNVVDIGLAATPTFYFAVSYYDFDGGIQITASHNPSEYNGAKIVKENAVAVGMGSGLEKIKEKALGGEYEEINEKGSLRQKEGVLAEQIDFAMEFVDSSDIKPFKVVIDTGNGMGAPMMEELFDRLPCEVVEMYFELDGNFPNHEANPLEEKNNEDIKQKIKDENADLGIALDGDGDRIFFFTDEGETVEPAILRAILSKMFLQDNPDSSICYDVRPGKITVDTIEENGGEPVVTRVGHTHIKRKAREVGAPFAGESSGHFFVDTGYGTYETPEIIALMMLKELSQADQSFSEYIEPYKKYSHSGEINFLVDDKEEVFDKLQEEFGENNIKYDFDGLTFEWSDWWFNVRASNTTPKVRLNLEGVNDEIVEEKVEEVSGVIGGEVV